MTKQGDAKKKEGEAKKKEGGETPHVKGEKKKEGDAKTKQGDAKKKKNPLKTKKVFDEVMTQWQQIQRNVDVDSAWSWALNNKLMKEADDLKGRIVAKSRENPPVNEFFTHGSLKNQKALK